MALFWECEEQVETWNNRFCWYERTLAREMLQEQNQKQKSLIFLVSSYTIYWQNLVKNYLVKEIFFTKNPIYELGAQTLQFSNYEIFILEHPAPSPFKVSTDGLHVNGHVISSELLCEIYDISSLVQTLFRYLNLIIRDSGFPNASAPEAFILALVLLLTKSSHGILIVLILSSANTIQLCQR